MLVLLLLSSLDVKKLCIHLSPPTASVTDFELFVLVGVSDTAPVAVAVATCVKKSRTVHNIRSE